MINFKITQDITNKQEQQLKLIEVLSNTQWKINLQWLDDEMLAMAVMQLTLQAKIKDLWLDFKIKGTQIWIKKNKDTEYTYIDLKAKNWKDGKDGINWINGTNWKDGKDWINWINGNEGKDWENGEDWKDGKDWVNWKDWINWKSVEFKIEWTRLWIKQEWDEEYKYVNLQWKNSRLIWFGWLIKASDVKTDTTTFNWTLSIVDDTVQKALETIDEFKTYVDDWLAEKLAINQNLADLDNKSTARTNLWLTAWWAWDIWVEKAWDTMTWALQVSNQTDAIKSWDYPIQAKSSVVNSSTAIGHIKDTTNFLNNASAIVEQWRSGWNKLLSLKYWDNVWSFSSDAPILSSNGFHWLFGWLVLECSLLGVIWFQSAWSIWNRLWILPNWPSFVTERTGSDASPVQIQFSSNSWGQSLFMFYKNTTNWTSFRPQTSATLGMDIWDSTSYKWNGSYFQDNAKQYSGNNKDSYVEYDWTDYIINPKNVWTGKVKIEWDIEVNAANTYRAWTAAWVSWSYTTADGKTVTVTKWIITSIV